MRWSAAEAAYWIICQKPLPLRNWTSVSGPEMGRAEHELSAAIADSRIEAWGRPEINGKAHGPLEKIPGDTFRNSSIQVNVTVHGEVLPAKRWKPYDGRRWRDIEFEVDQVKRAWPAPACDTVNDRMLREAQKRLAAGRLGKRDDMVKDCMQATGCTKREAEAAHKALPPELRRVRGKPPKQVG